MDAVVCGTWQAVSHQQLRLHVDSGDSHDRAIALVTLIVLLVVAVVFVVWTRVTRTRVTVAMIVVIVRIFGLLSHSLIMVRTAIMRMMQTAAKY
jgi:Mg2+/Co2+ transporter CorB